MGAHYQSDPGGAGPPPVIVAPVLGASDWLPGSFGAPQLRMSVAEAGTAAFRCAGEFL